jgi:hypothetical protein
MLGLSLIINKYFCTDFSMTNIQERHGVSS